MNPEPDYSAAYVVRTDADDRYLAPTTPDTSAEMHRQSVLDHRFPDGPVWRDA